jgi:hypothetical protein
VLWCVVRLPRSLDPAAVFEGIFARNGWTDGWRDGVYDYLHYHSRIHEVMGLRAARAKVRFGKHGRTFKLSAGDVVILPAGTGRKCIAASRRFLAVGPIHPSAPMMSAFRPKPGTPAIQYAYAIRILFSAPRGRASDGRQRERERERERTEPALSGGFLRNFLPLYAHFRQSNGDSRVLVAVVASLYRTGRR